MNTEESKMEDKQLIEIGNPRRGGCYVNFSSPIEEIKDNLLHNLVSSSSRLESIEDYVFWLMTPDIFDGLDLKDRRQIRDVKQRLQRLINKLTVLETGETK
jgi:hypothetical protein